MMSKKGRRGTRQPDKSLNTQAARWSPVIERASGVVIIGVGLYFLWIA